jgi:hypothetical protein
MASHKGPLFSLILGMSLRQVAKGGLFFNSVGVWKVPTIYSSVSNLVGSALHNYEKKISGLSRISKVYVTSKNCTLIISLLVMPES